MAISLIDTVTPDVGLKTGAEKMNSNFTDTENAASRLVGSQADRVPLNSDLGTAATADKQTGPTDTTAGRLMAVGAGGLLGRAIVFTGDLDNLNASGYYQVPQAGAANQPPGTSAGAIFTSVSVEDARRVQIFEAVEAGAAETYVRHSSATSVWTPWAKLINSANEQQIGVGQTWQDLTASRAAATTYTNTTGKPICFAVKVTGSTRTAFTLIVDGFDVARNDSEPSVSNATTVANAIVPAGSTYNLKLDVGDLSQWMELR